MCYLHMTFWNVHSSHVIYLFHFHHFSFLWFHHFSYHLLLDLLTYADPVKITNYNIQLGKVQTGFTLSDECLVSERRGLRRCLRSLLFSLARSSFRGDFLSFEVRVSICRL